MASQRAKENILGKIRQALRTPTGRPAPKPDFSSSVFVRTAQDPSVAFAEAFIGHKGEFFFCDGKSDFLTHLSLFLQKKGLREIYVWEEELMALVAEKDIPFRQDDAAFLTAEAGITGCEALIVRTGSILVSSRQAAGRRLSIYPPVHIVVAYTSQLVEDIKDGLHLVQEKYGTQLPSMISMITGPSRTADIEKTLVLGAHGPKELALFLIEGQWLKE